MRKRRVFIAILPPEDLREKLFLLSKKWPGLPCRWLKPENIHLTIIPPTYLDENELADLINALKEIAPGSHPFNLNMEKIIYGPPGKPARMIWAIGKESPELENLRKILAQTVAKTNLPFRSETRPLLPHLTLARMFPKEWSRLENKPKIDETFPAEFPVASIEVMESELHRTGAEYRLLERIPLGQ